MGEDPSCWDKNMTKIIKQLYTSMTLLPKRPFQKFQEFQECCSVVWANNITVAQSNAIERLQVVALKIIMVKDCPRKEDGHCDFETLLGL